MLVHSHLVDARFQKARMLHFKRERHLVITPEAFADFVGDHPPQAEFLDLPPITGVNSMRSLLPSILQQEDCVAGHGTELKLSLSWFVGLAPVVHSIGTTGCWPQSLADAHIAMTPTQTAPAVCPPSSLSHLGFGQAQTSAASCPGPKLSVWCWAVLAWENSMYSWLMWSHLLTRLTGI